MVLLVEKDQKEFVLKVANSVENNPQIQAEADVLPKLRHNHVVEMLGTQEIGDRMAIQMRPIFANRKERRIETLSQRLKQDGRLQPELLERFGEDLLNLVQFLEDKGIPHRDNQTR